MFDHVKFGVRDFDASKAFYLQVLAPIGVTVVTDWPPRGAELSQPGGHASLCLYQTEEKPAHLHIAFVAESRQQVDAFYAAASSPGFERCVQAGARRPRRTPADVAGTTGLLWPPCPRRSREIDPCRCRSC